MCILFLLHASPTQFPSCYLLTQPSLLHLMTSSYPPVDACFSLHSRKSENNNYHSCHILSASPPSAFSCKISRHTVTLHFLFLLLFSPKHNFPSVLGPSWLPFSCYVLEFYVFLLFFALFHIVLHNPQVITEGGAKDSQMEKDIFVELLSGVHTQGCKRWCH